MAYCTIEDVNSLVPQAQFTDGPPPSKPTAAAVKRMIDDISTYIDGRLSHIYITPIAGGPRALQQLRQLCSWGALGRAQEARWTNVTSLSTPSQLINVGEWTRKFEKELDRLINPDDPYELLDAVKNVDAVIKQPSELLDGSMLHFTPEQDHYDLDNPNVTRSQVF